MYPSIICHMIKYSMKIYIMIARFFQLSPHDNANCVFSYYLLSPRPAKDSWKINNDVIALLGIPEAAHV